MGLIVQKFGGSSVKDRNRIFNVARIVMNTRNAGNDVVVVVSAQGDTTDDLIAKAAEITSDPSHREMDMLLAAGEEISISLLAMALQELTAMGIDNIITFDAHDPRVQNSIPLNGFETVQASYQFIKNLLRTEPDLQIDSNHMMVISPDEGGMGRAIYIANVLGLDMGMFYKRRDYTRVVNGRNPIVAHEFLGTSVEGKDMIIIDDMISSGESVLEVASALKQRGARKIFICTTFGLFTSGMEKFDKAYACGNINRVLTTNLIYQPEELLKREWYVNCDMSKYVAYLIDTLNHDTSISDLLDPNDKIQAAVAKYKKGLALDNDD